MHYCNHNLKKAPRGDATPSEREHLPPVDPVELLGRLRVILGVLSPNRKTHSVSPSNVASNHPLVRNIFPNLPLQLRLDLQVFQRVVPSLRRTTRTGFGSEGCQGIRSGGTKFRTEARTCKREALNGLCGGRRGEEGGDRSQLCRSQVFHPTPVVNLEPSADAVCGFVTDAVEVCQRELQRVHCAT